MVIWSDEARKIIQIEVASERKATKYHDLVQQCRNKEWQAWLFPVEISCRGFLAQSVRELLTALGIAGRQRKTAVCMLGEREMYSTANTFT